MNRADQRKFHYIYRITRIDESGKYYIGMHSTDDLDDGYFGSGSLLSKSIKKYGKEKHIKEILEFLPSREALKLREKEIVNEELLGDKKCMNLKLGGSCWPASAAKLGGMTAKSKGVGWFSDASKKKAQIANKQLFESGKRTGSFLGKSHTPETLQKMSETKRNNLSQVGKNNSQFGTCVVSNGVEYKRIQLSEIVAFEDLGFYRKPLHISTKNKTLEEYERLSPVCRNIECSKPLSLFQFRKRMTSCSKACSNITRINTRSIQR